jgi:hypothetical protein
LRLLGWLWFFRGDFVKSRQFLNEAVSIADELISPVVHGFAQTGLGIIFILEENDLEEGERLIIESYPPETPSDFRSLTAFLAQSIVAIEHGNYVNAIQPIVQFSKSWAMGFRPDYVLWCAGSVAIILAEYRHAGRAVEVMSQVIHHPLLAMGWVDHWQHYQKLEAQLKAELGAETFQMHWEQGKHIDFKQVIAFFQALEDNV